MPNPIIDGITIGGTTYDLKDPNLTDEVTELKSTINDKAPAIFAESSAKNTFSVNEFASYTNGYYLECDASGYDTVIVAKSEDILPITDGQTESSFFTKSGTENTLHAEGSRTKDANFYSRVGGNASYEVKKTINAGDTILFAITKKGTITTEGTGTSPIKASIIFKYTDETTNENTVSLSIDDEKKISSLTASKDVSLIAIYILFRKDYTYDIDVSWSMIFSDTEYEEKIVPQDGMITVSSAEIGNNGYTIFPPKAVLKYVSDTKTYIDESIPEGMLTKEDLVYLSPEMYGATGDGVTNDATAIQDCIDAAITAGVPVRGFGKYAITSPIELSGSNMNFYLHRLSYTGNDAAVIISGSSNLILIDAISAWNSTGCAVRIVNNNSDTIHNEIRIGAAFAYTNAIEIIQGEQETNSIYYNRFYLGRLSARTENCIYIDAGRFAENIFYGNLLTCNNGWAIYAERSEGTRNVFSGFGIEAACKNGVYGIYTLHNCRTVECMDTKRPDNDSGTIIRIPSGMLPTRCKWDDLTYVDYANIDVSLCRTFSDCLNILKDSYENGATRSGAYDIAFTYYKNNVLGHAYRIGTYQNMPNQIDGLFPMPGHIIAYFNHKGFVPENGWYKQIITSTYTPFVTEAAFPTEFDLTVDCDIHFEDSYCAVGIKDVLIHQYENAKATVYDRDGNVIFNGQNNPAGSYKLHCSWIPYTITVETTKGNLTYTRGDYYYGSMCDRWTVEKLNIV